MNTSVGNFITNVKRVALSFMNDNATSNVEVCHVSPTHMDIYVHGKDKWVNLNYEVHKGEEYAFITIGNSDGVKSTDHETINMLSANVDNKLKDNWSGLIASLKEL